MKFPISKKLTAGFALALAILTISIVLPYQNILRLTETNNSVVTLPQPQQLDNVDSLITEKLTHSSEILVSRRRQGVESIQLQLVSLASTSTGETQRITYA